MNVVVSRLLRAGVLAGGLLAVGAGVAHADETTTGQHGVLSGNQVVVPVTAPVGVDGDAIAVLGRAVTHGSSAPVAASTGRSADRSPQSVRTSGHHRVGSGNQVVVPVRVPVRVDGDAVAVLGRASTAAPAAPAGGGSGTGSSAPPAATTDGSGGVGSGNQVVVPADLPVTVAGDPVSVLGTSTTGSPGTAPGTPGGSAPGTPTGPAGGTGDGASVLGEQLVADAVPTSVPSLRPAALAFTGGVPTRLVSLGAALLGLGVLSRRLGRERIRSAEKWGSTTAPGRGATG